MGKKIFSVGLILLLVLGSVVSYADAKENSPSKSNPKYFFYFIGDGMGDAQRQVAEYYNQEVGESKEKLAMNQFKTSSIYTIHAENTLVTDSAAAGTAMATGHKTTNGTISETSKGEHLKTLAEAAKEKGMSVGIATTTRITHATPAVFISHNESRGNENEIAVDYLDSGVDYLVGGGIRHFIPQNFPKDKKDAFGKTIKSKRKDSRNLLDEFKKNGYNVHWGEKGVKDFRNYQPQKGDKYMALFTYSHLPYTLDDPEEKVPTAAEITKKGIEVLSKNEKGFFFMFEGGRIDHACHANDIAASIHDTLALDKAVKVAVDFYKKHPNETLILVGADHETGGLGLGKNTDYFLNLKILEKVKKSVEDQFVFNKGQTRVDAVVLAKENFGMEALTLEELNMLDKAIELNDSGKFKSGNKYEYNEVGQALAHILSDRASLYWTTNGHTATLIPLSVLGVGAEKFDGFIDNTDIPKIAAKIFSLDL